MNKIPKSSHKKGGAKKEYTGTYRHFTLHEVDGYDRNDIGTATIKDHQNPLDAAKKLLSSWYRHLGIKSNERNKHDIKFTIRETTRGHSKIYGPYKGKFIKYDKPLMIKLKSGKVIKRIGKSMVKLAKGNNKKMFGGESNGKIIVKDKDHLKELISDKNTNFSDLDVSKVNDMSQLFSEFNFSNRTGNSDISNWNVSNVNNMQNMFYRSDTFNQDLSNWNVSNVRNMVNMFFYCKNFDKPLEWNVNSTLHIEKDMHDIFDGCFKLFINPKFAGIKETKLLDTSKIKLMQNGKTFFVAKLQYSKSHHSKRKIVEWVDDPAERIEKIINPES